MQSIVMQSFVCPSENLKRGVCQNRAPPVVPQPPKTLNPTTLYTPGVIWVLAVFHPLRNPFKIDFCRAPELTPSIFLACVWTRKYDYSSHVAEGFTGPNRTLRGGCMVSGWGRVGSSGFLLVRYQAVLVQNRGWLEVLRQLMLKSCMTLSTQKLGNFGSLFAF